MALSGDFYQDQIDRLARRIDALEKQAKAEPEKQEARSEAKSTQIAELIANIDAGDRMPEDPLVILAEEVKRLRTKMSPL